MSPFQQEPSQNEEVEEHSLRVEESCELRVRGAARLACEPQVTMQTRHHRVCLAQMSAARPPCCPPHTVFVSIRGRITAAPDLTSSQRLPSSSSCLVALFFCAALRRLRAPAARPSTTTMSRTGASFAFHPRVLSPMPSSYPCRSSSLSLPKRHDGAVRRVGHAGAVQGSEHHQVAPPHARARVAV